MEPWNFTCIVIGIANLIGVLVRDKLNPYSEKYFDKLEKKYGNIDRAKVVKLDNMYTITLGLIFIVVGILVKDKDMALICLISMIIGMTTTYYLVRKKYIVIDKL
jgi:uncharacterized Tic20 family protein